MEFTRTRKARIYYRIKSLAEFQIKSTFDKYLGYSQNLATLLMANNSYKSQEKFNMITESIYKDHADSILLMMLMETKLSGVSVFWS